MPTYPNESTVAVRKRLLDGMVSYMQQIGRETANASDCGYSQEHIDRCAEIVDAYLAGSMPNHKLLPDQILAAAKQAVLNLNALNKESDWRLIETDQREELCELILIAAKLAGLETDEDITEEWREW